MAQETEEQKKARLAKEAKDRANKMKEIDKKLVPNEHLYKKK